MLSVLIACVKIANYSGRNPIITRSVFILSPIMTMFTLYLFLKILYYRVSEYRLETFVAVFGTVCVNLLIFVLFDRTLTAERENSVLQLHKNKTELERRTYAELLRMNDRLATVKHDLNNHLLYVKRHMENGDRSAIEDYVRNIESMIDSVETPPVTGNGMLDYIISSKLKDEKDIAFVASGDAGIPDGMDELDIALLMGNLLDNAIEAVRRVRKKEKLIEMNFRTFNGYRNITMRNDISTSVLAHNESLTTTKDDKQSHGFGLRSVRNIVGKYNGIIECYEEDGKFCVHLAFPA
jgi:sensor histidine kinase regulating citrate/malate metabolism